MNLEIGALRKQYQGGKVTPAEVVEFVCDRISAQQDDHVWIHRISRRELFDRARTLEKGPPDLPLYEIPFGSAGMRPERRPRRRNGGAA